MAETAPFDPTFDDARWASQALSAPVPPVPVGAGAGGFRVVARRLHRLEIFGRVYALDQPLAVRALVDASGLVWMSDAPQERMMMYNDAAASRGHVLVGGLGLALYPLYARHHAERLTIVERSREVFELVAPGLRGALHIPVELVLDDIRDVLQRDPTTRYDTIFLDTWHTLDPLLLPEINHLRDLAIHHLAPGGRVLLWGYRWILRMLLDTCAELLRVPPARREPWLHTAARPGTADFLRPVLDRFAREETPDLPTALRWCRAWGLGARELRG